MSIAAGMASAQSPFPSQPVRLTKPGAPPIGSSPPQFDARIGADYRKWGPIIEAAGIRVE